MDMIPGASSEYMPWVSRTEDCADVNITMAMATGILSDLYSIKYEGVGVFKELGFHPFGPWGYH